MVKIIAEVGVNHNGEKDLAMKLVTVAHSAGADVVKFQTFKADSLVTADAQQADYQIRNMGAEEAQLSMLSRLELDYGAHKELTKYCNEIGIEFMSTAFDSQSLEFLVKDLGIKTLKIASGELTNLPFVLEHARTGCELIVSTGMASLGEIEVALGVIAFGLTTDSSESPSLAAFAKAYASQAGQERLREKVTLLHCTTEYPAPLGEINLRAMETIRAAFGLRAGYSDHSDGITVPIAAAALGACVLEKHFTLDKTMEGPDHKASVDPEGLSLMIQSIKDASEALGSEVKSAQPSEIDNKVVARKSLFAARPITEGQIISEADICIKRPGNGIEPSRYWQIIGMRASKSYTEGQLIDG